MISETLIVILCVKPNGNLNECPSEQFAARKYLNIFTHAVFKKIPSVSEFHFKVLSGIYESSRG